MGKTEKERVSKKESATGNKLNNITHVKGVNFYRNAKQVKQLNIMKGGKPTRNKQGRIIKAADFQNRLASGTMARVQSNKQYWTNTRVIGQKELSDFRDAMKDKMDDSYTVLLKQNKLPMSLLNDHSKVIIIFFKLILIFAFFC